MWDEEFSALAKHLKASEIRELLKVTQEPDIISLAGGLPSPQAFPVDIIKNIVSYMMDKYGDKMLQYGSTEGVNSFRDTLVDFLTSRYKFKNIERDNILVTTGSQQGLYLSAKIFIDPGDTVIVEAPTYVGVLTAFQSYNPKYEQIEMDNDGMKVDMLEDRLRELKRENVKPKLIYTIPTFQNPAGVTLSEDRRKYLLELAEEYDILVIEDAPYEELRFSGEPVPQIKRMDKDDRVIYLGTFSKTLSPGMRIAYMVAHKDIIQKAVLAKQGVDLCTTPFLQYVAQEYLKGGYFDEHIPKIIKIYKEKRDVMLDALEDYFPEGVSWTKPDGGMFLWVTLPEGMDAQKLFNRAIKNKVAFVIGAAFFPYRDHKNTLRLNFTYPSIENIQEGIKRLANAIKEEM
ncbi:aminotransferase, classes I and II superfamily [Aciduliprofundum boonei T469]|nr:aminotransferase, classes I and II superfamily [Aciduliprofundum boonei T469]